MRRFYDGFWNLYTRFWLEWIPRDLAQFITVLLVIAMLVVVGMAVTMAMKLLRQAREGDQDNQ